MTCKLAVFDMAGTTLNDDKAVWNAFNKAFESKGHTISEEMVNPLMGYKKPVAIGMILKKIGADSGDAMVAEIHEVFINEMKDYYEFSEDVKAIDGAEAAMHQLKQKGIRIALNTGFSREIADTIVERLQWKELGVIDDYIASDDVPAGRPDPSMINTLMQRAGITDSKQVVKIGDTEVDINEGRNAGCSLVIAVTTGAFTRAELEPYHPDYILDNLSELPTLIFNHE
jgi:phosphonatase-like hydrolase